MGRVVVVQDSKIRKVGERIAQKGTKVFGTYKGTADEWAKSGKRVRVKSSNVVAIWYDKATKRLYVEFKGKAVYYYPSVTIAIAKRQFNAASMGRHIWWLRRAGYVGVKV